MIIYLYVKTHNKTGLKYLGKTTRSDPHAYEGSGTYWLRHLKKYGYDYSTEILQECQSNKEVREWGMYYSNLYDVVNAKDEHGNKTWANLKPEYGDGDDSETARRKALKRISEGTHNFQGESNPSRRLVKEGTHNFQGARNPNHQKIKDGSHPFLGKNNPVHALYATGSHYVQTEEFSKLMSEVQRRELAKGVHPLQKGNRPKGICPHCGKKGDLYVMKRWHFDKCKSISIG